MSEVTEFAILQLKSQLESSLEQYGSQHRETLKFLLQYSKLLGTYAESQSNNKAIQILNQAFKLLLPEKPPKLLTIQFQYWRLLIVTAIKLSKALEINGQLQQGLNVMIQIENLYKKYHNSLEWAQNVELEYLYYHLALLWEKQQNQERTYYAANECILLIKSNLKNKSEPKQIHMLTEMLHLQSETKNTPQQQLPFYNQILSFQSKYLSNSSKETIKTAMRINQLKSQIQFEKEIDEFNKDDFQKKQPIQENSQVDFYGEEKSINFDQGPQIKPFNTKEFLRSKLFHQPKKILIKNQNNSQSKTSLKISHVSKKSAEDLKRYTDSRINLKINSRTSSQGENKFFYFINSLQNRTKTDTTQLKTQMSKNQDRLTPSQAVLLRCKTNKSNVSLNSAQTNHQLEKPTLDENLKSLMTQRPNSSLAYQRLAKQLQVTVNNPPQQKIMKRLNTQDLLLKKKNQSQQLQILPSELSTKKSNQAQDIQFALISQKSIRAEEIIVKSEKELYEIYLDKIIKIQRYFRAKQQQKKPQTKITFNKFSLKQLTEEDMVERTPMARSRCKEIKHGYQRSNTSSIESLRNKREFFLQPSKQKDHSFHSQASSKVINIKSGSNSQIVEQSSESLIIQQDIWTEEINGSCWFFCSDQSDRILKLNCLKAKCINQNEESCNLIIEITVESQFKTHIIKLPLEIPLKNLKNISKYKGIQFFQLLFQELITNYYELLPQITFVLIYLGDELVNCLESIINNISILMTHISAQRRLNGVRLTFSKDIHVKSNRKMIQYFYQKQRTEQRQNYFKAQQYFSDKYNIKVNIRASQSDIYIRGFMGSDSARQKLKATENAVLFAVRAKHTLESPIKPPTIPLMLFEDSEIVSPILEVSIRDPDVNRTQLKNIINPQKLRQSIPEIEMNRFSNLFQQHQKVHHQRNLSNNSQKQVGESLFKKTFTLEANPFQNRILINPNKNKNDQKDESFTEKSASPSISETKGNVCDLLPPSVTQSQQCLHKKNVSSVIPSDNNLLDTQQLLVANQLFDTQALEGLDLIPEQENELEPKIETIYKRDDHFTVSPEWRKKRKRTIHNFEMEYFWNQHKVEKKVFQNIFNNPFNQTEQLLAGTLKIDKQFFIVSINQILKENVELFNQSTINNRELVKIQIIFRLANYQWEDIIIIKFKEFLKWFVPDFEISNYVRQFGLSKQQKVQALQNLTRYAHIKESKLKLEYFEERKQKTEQQTRRTIEMQRMIAIENLIRRERLDFKYIEHLGLTNLFEELLKERTFRDEKKKKKDERYKVFLQLTNPNQLESETLGPKYIGLDYDGESEEKTLQVPQELQMQVLKSYNTIIHLRAETHIFRIGQSYLIWEGDIIKLWRPFQRKIWQWIKVENKEKLINALQCNLKDYLLKQILSKNLSINGYKYIFKKKQDLQKQSKNQEYLYSYFQQKQFTNLQFYHFLSLLRSELLSDQNNVQFWNTFFKQYKQLQHCYINNLGDCLLEMTIYVDNQNKLIAQNTLPSYTFIRVNIFEKKNMKTRMHKLALTLQDLQITTKMNYESIQKIFDDTQKMMTKFVQYEFLGVSKQPSLTIKNIKNNGTNKLINKLPWIEKFNYDDFKITLYPQKFNFYNFQVKSSKIICKVIRFIDFPQLIQNQYETYNGTEFLEPKFKRIPAIITIEKFSDLQSFYIYIYFPQNSRKFMSKLHFDDIQFETDSNLKINFQLKEQLRQHRSDKQWQNLISSFKVSFNQQNKLILSIEKLKNIQCVLQEVIYQKIKEIKNDIIMFIVNIEKRHDKEVEYIHISHSSMKLSDAKNYTIFLKFQWLNVQDKIQSYRLPLYELMIGYYEKVIKKDNVFDYKFKLAELIHMCSISIENIIMNFSQQDFYNNTLEYLMPQQLTYNLHQRMKLNINLKTIQIDKSRYYLLYRGLLLKQPQIIVAIYKKMNKKKLYFYVQRMNDGECFIHKIRFQEIENIYPGFSANLKNNQRQIGPNVFKILKNRLIVQSYYQLN